MHIGLLGPGSCMFLVPGASRKVENCENECHEFLVVEVTAACLDDSIFGNTVDEEGP